MSKNATTADKTKTVKAETKTPVAQSTKPVAHSTKMEQKPERKSLIDKIKSIFKR